MVFFLCASSLSIPSSHLIQWLEKWTLKNLISLIFINDPLHLYEIQILYCGLQDPKGSGSWLHLDFMSYHFPFHSLNPNQISIWSSFTMTGSYPSHLHTFTLAVLLTWNSLLLAFCIVVDFGYQIKYHFPKVAFSGHHIETTHYFFLLLFYCIALLTSFRAFFLIYNYIV